jgi:hypothetical protein
MSAIHLPTVAVNAALNINPDSKQSLSYTTNSDDDCPPPPPFPSSESSGSPGSSASTPDKSLSPVTLKSQSQQSDMCRPQLPSDSPSSGSSAILALKSDESPRGRQLQRHCRHLRIHEAVKRRESRHQALRQQEIWLEMQNSWFDEPEAVELGLEKDTKEKTVGSNNGAHENQGSGLKEVLSVRLRSVDDKKNLKEPAPRLDSTTKSSETMGYTPFNGWGFRSMRTSLFKNVAAARRLNSCEDENCCYLLREEPVDEYMYWKDRQESADYAARVILASYEAGARRNGQYRRPHRHGHRRGGCNANTIGRRERKKRRALRMKDFSLDLELRGGDAEKDGLEGPKKKRGFKAFFEKTKEISEKLSWSETLGRLSIFQAVPVSPFGSPMILPPMGTLDVAGAFTGFRNNDDSSYRYQGDASSSTSKTDSLTSSVAPSYRSTPISSTTNMATDKAEVQNFRRCHLIKTDNRNISAHPAWKNYRCIPPRLKNQRWSAPEYFGHGTHNVYDAQEVLEQKLGLGRKRSLASLTRQLAAKKVKISMETF